MISRGGELNKMSIKDGAKETLGKKVREYRTKRGLDQRELALILGVSSPTISNIERDKKTPSLKTLVKIAKALHCSINDLVNED